MASDDAFIKKLHAELSVTEGRKDQWQNELDSLSKVPTTAQAASERCALACAAAGSGGGRGGSGRARVSSREPGTRSARAPSQHLGVGEEGVRERPVHERLRGRGEPILAATQERRRLHHPLTKFYDDLPPPRGPLILPPPRTPT